MVIAMGNRLVRTSLSLLIGLLMILPGLVRAEEFTQPAFQAQWNATDAVVAKGQVSRTYFWGPAPFAHTNEVYAEGPGGVRQVQYFDKARMELTKRPGTDPNFVTNGLLTVELVTGQLQVGDNQFISRQPATNPVAGDQVNNPLTPTYASFNQGKLAFGVKGSQNATNRTGQAISEAVNKDGQVSTLTQPAVNLKYAQYFPQTGHNVADVFYNFFQADPLGADKWLNVMGYPISEPFWAKDKVIVGGQSRDVLIQLFQRRALTYTPANPAGFQVEMGNIGQHYYVWRYGFDTHDQLPGNYRVVGVINGHLYSISTTNPADKLDLGPLPAPISSFDLDSGGLTTLGGGRALLRVKDKFYLADLTRARPFKQLALPADYPVKSRDANVLFSQATQQLVLLLPSAAPQPPDETLVQVYQLSGPGEDNLNISHSYTLAKLQTPLFTVFSSLSPDGHYLAYYQPNSGVNVLTLSGDTAKAAPIKFGVALNRATWLSWVGGGSNQLLVSLGQSFSSNPDGSKRGVVLLNLSNQKVSTLLNDDDMRYAEGVPGTDEFVVLRAYIDHMEVSFRTLANPTTSQAPTYEANGQNFYGYWDTDATSFNLFSQTQRVGGSAQMSITKLSVISGKPIWTDQVEDYGSLDSQDNIQVNKVNFVTPIGVLKNHYVINYDTQKLVNQTLTFENKDGSQRVTLVEAANSAAILDFAQVVQVPKN